MKSILLQLLVCMIFVLPSHNSFAQSAAQRAAMQQQQAAAQRAAQQAAQRAAEQARAAQQAAMQRQQALMRQQMQAQQTRMIQMQRQQMQDQRALQQQRMDQMRRQQMADRRLAVQRQLRTTEQQNQQRFLTQRLLSQRASVANNNRRPAANDNNRLVTANSRATRVLQHQRSERARNLARERLNRERTEQRNRENRQRQERAQADRDGALITTKVLASASRALPKPANDYASKYHNIVRFPKRPASSGGGKGGGRTTGGSGDNVSFQLTARHSTRNPESKVVMLGKWENGGPNCYTSKAGQVQGKATYYQTKQPHEAKFSDGRGNDVWSRINRNGRDHAFSFNKAFLDRQVRMGKKFLLSHDPHDPKVASGDFKKELDYLRERHGLVPSVKPNKDGYWELTN